MNDAVKKDHKNKLKKKLFWKFNFLIQKYVKLTKHANKNGATTPTSKPTIKFLIFPQTKLTVALLNFTFELKEKSSSLQQIPICVFL
jgi:hypothetical protein